MEEYKWVLVWRGIKDGPMVRAIGEQIKEYPIARDAMTHLVTYGEYMAMVERGETAPPRPYWRMTAGNVGAVALSAYCTIQYDYVWDEIGTMKDDFAAGWMACLESLTR